MNNSLTFTLPLTAPPAIPASQPMEDFEMAIETMIAQVQVTARQLDRSASRCDHPDELRFIDGLITDLLFFEAQWVDFDEAAVQSDVEIRSATTERLIQGAISFCEKSAVAQFEFGRRALANRLRELAKSCHAAYMEMPEQSVVGERSQPALPEKPRSELAAA